MHIVGASETAAPHACAKRQHCLLALSGAWACEMRPAQGVPLTARRPAARSMRRLPHALCQEWISSAAARREASCCDSLLQLQLIVMAAKAQPLKTCASHPRCLPAQWAAHWTSPLPLTAGQRASRCWASTACALGLQTSGPSGGSTVWSWDLTNHLMRRLTCTHASQSTFRQVRGTRDRALAEA